MNIFDKYVRIAFAPAGDDAGGGDAGASTAAPTSEAPGAPADTGDGGESVETLVDENFSIPDGDELDTIEVQAPAGPQGNGADQSDPKPDAKAAPGKDPKEPLKADPAKEPPKEAKKPGEEGPKA